MTLAQALAVVAYFENQIPSIRRPVQAAYDEARDIVSRAATEAVDSFNFNTEKPR